VRVDVVGQMRPLDCKEGEAQFAIGPSPVYILAKSDYDELTRFK